MTKKIVQSEHEALRRVSQPVAKEEIGGTGLKRLIEEMATSLAKEEDGVALAAPQIGVNKRLFIISGKILPTPTKQPMVFINPKIVRLSKKIQTMEEGCLSVRYWYGLVRRAERATVEAVDENGKPFTRNGSGLMAQIFQHEIEHLDGHLFTDRATSLQEIPPNRLNDKT